MWERLLAVGFASLLAACAASAPQSTPATATFVPQPTLAPTPTTSASQRSTPTASAELPSWAELHATGPPAREDHTWTMDGEGRLAYLFGGRDATTVFDDLWAFDLDRDTWTRIDAPPGPQARFGHEAAWVDGVGLVIFAGQAGSRFFADLWAFSPAAGTWAMLPADGAAPVARYGTCAAVGPDGRLWISHGFTADGSRFADTLAYDFEARTWTDETPDGDAPVERCLHACWWTDDGSLALYAGQTTGVLALGDRWLLSDGTWAQVDGALPQERNLYAHARLEGATLVFGGQALDGSYLADVWLIVDDGADAVTLEAAGPAPPGRAGAEMVLDADHDRLLLFGGRDAGGARADMWQLAGGITADR